MWVVWGDQGFGVDAGGILGGVFHSRATAEFAMEALQAEPFTSWRITETLVGAPIVP